MAVVFQEQWPGTNGSAWDAGRWPIRSQGPNVTVDVQGSRGRMLCEEPPDRALAWALAGHDPVTDFDLLLDWTPGNSDTFRLGIIFGRTSDTAGNMLYIRPFSGTSGQIRLYNGIDLNQDLTDDVAEIAAGTELVNQAISFSSPATTRYACRVQREGNILRCRVWPHGSSEPGTWQIDTTLTANPSGVIGVMAMGHEIGEEPDIRWGPINLQDDGEPGPEIGIPENVQVTLTGPTEATVTWDPVDGADAYQVEARVRAGVEE